MVATEHLAPELLYGILGWIRSEPRVWRAVTGQVDGGRTVNEMEKIKNLNGKSYK